MGAGISSRLPQLWDGVCRIASEYFPAWESPEKPLFGENLSVFHLTHHCESHVRRKVPCGSGKGHVGQCALEERYLLGSPDDQRQNLRSSGDPKSGKHEKCGTILTAFSGRLRTMKQTLEMRKGEQYERISS